MQQTKLQLNNSRLIIEIAVQAAAEKQRMFAGGTCRCFISWTNLTHNYTLWSQGLILLVD